MPEPVAGRVLARLNRFVVEVVAEGRVERAYVNNTGRLLGLLTRGRACYCLRRSGGSTSLRLFAVEDGGEAALIDTAIQGRAFERALKMGALPWAPCDVIARNPRLGSSIFDYLLSCGGRSIYAELKSAVLRDGVHAAYPDCPTPRGRRHIIDLAKHAERGGGALIVFIAALPGVAGFKPYERGDPEIPRLLREAVSRGVSVKAASMYYEPESSSVVLEEPDLPVLL